MHNNTLRVDLDRLLARLFALAKVGATSDGGVCRLAFTESDKVGRELVISLMKKLGLTVSIDQIGNVMARREGLEDLDPVYIGSHIDSVRTGGQYDGTLGVLAGLEIVATLNDANLTTRRPLVIAFFSNEEGARFAPDMMGSMVHQGHLRLSEALSMRGIDGATVAEELTRLGQAGPLPCGGARAHAYVELHIEQGPVLERDGITIGAVEGVQGISWTEVNIIGTSNHAGTTPMSMRHDAGAAAAAIVQYARKLARDIGGDQVATVGYITFTPNIVNVIPGRASLTVDLRNTDEERLRFAEERLYKFLTRLAKREDVYLARRSLARYKPTAFDEEVIELVRGEASALGHSVRRMASGAGHDAQSFAPNCPTGMIFVPSVGGISHNPQEFTHAKDIQAGANVLLQVALTLLER